MPDRRTVALLGLGLAASGLGVWLSRQGMLRGPMLEASALVGAAWPGDGGTGTDVGPPRRAGEMGPSLGLGAVVPALPRERAGTAGGDGAGTLIWGLLSWDNPAWAGDALRGWGVPYARIAMDRDGCLARARGARGVPHGVLLVPGGVEIRRIHGRFDVARARTEGLL